ncbi:MAG: terminase gpA endonuclease subunit [Propylenella sp.]
MFADQTLKGVKSRIAVVALNGEKVGKLADVQRSAASKLVANSARLVLDPGGRIIRFSHDLEPRFCEELASERLVVKYARGMPTRRWERKPGVRAECLDATVYTLALRSIVVLTGSGVGEQGSTEGDAGCHEEPVAV